MRDITLNLSIGNATDAREHGPDFDRVVSLASAHDDYTTHRHTINDGDHDYTTFSNAVDSIRTGLQNDEHVLVHCNAGLSRSVSAAIAALVVETDMTYDDAYDACRSGFIYPAPELIDSARHYINQHN
jgi:atypical dual specificity phosphatase